jgi:hypothetical protein
MRDGIYPIERNGRVCLNKSPTHPRVVDQGAGAFMWCTGRIRARFALSFLLKRLACC